MVYNKTQSVEKTTDNTLDSYKLMKVLDMKGLEHYNQLMEKKFDKCLKNGGEVSSISDVNMLLSNGCTETEEMDCFIKEDLFGVKYIGVSNVILTLLYDNRLTAGSATSGFYIPVDNSWMSIDEKYGVDTITTPLGTYYRFNIGSQLISFKDGDIYKWKVFRKA